MITTVSTSAALSTALSTAHAGDTILLKTGTYAPISISGKTFTSDVTIRSETPDAPAVLTGLKVLNSSGFSFSDLELRVDPAGGFNQFQVSGSRNIDFARLDVHGTLDGNPQNDAGGFEIKESSGISVTDSEFQQLYYALGHRDVAGLTISGNSFHDIRMDGVRGSGSSSVLISRNTFTDFDRVVGDHSDAIQFWVSPTISVVSGITISDNQILRGDGTAMQGVFLNTDGGSQYFRDVTIVRNLIVGSNYNGIAVTGGRNVTVENNVVVGCEDQNSWIRLENVAGGTIQGNQVNVVLTTANVTGVSIGGNTILPPNTDDGAALSAEWELRYGGAVTAEITGDTGANTLNGTAGADTIAGNGGADVLSGGAGNDVYVTDAAAKVVEASTGGVDTVRTSGTYILGESVENLELTGGANVTGKGNNYGNVITGNVGSNGLYGKIGADTLYGGAGADTLGGGSGNDVLTGGSGADVFVFIKGDGDDVIRDFGASGAHDALDFSALYALGLKATLTDATAGVTISFTTGDSVLLQGIHIADLHATSTGYVF